MNAVKNKPPEKNNDGEYVCPKCKCRLDDAIDYPHDNSGKIRSWVCFANNCNYEWEG